MEDKVETTGWNQAVEILERLVIAFRFLWKPLRSPWRFFEQIFGRERNVDYSPR